MTSKTSPGNLLSSENQLKLSLLETVYYSLLYDSLYLEGPFFYSIYHPTLLLASIPVFTIKHILFIFICTAWSMDPVAQKSFNKSTLNSKEVGELGKRQSLKLNERKKDHHLPERSQGVGNGNLLQYSCLENSMERGTWQATVQGVAKS